MIPLSIFPRAEGMLEDVPPETILEVNAHLRMGALADGTVGGNPAVAICVPLPDGRMVVAQTTLKLLLMAADAFKAVHGDPRR